VRAFGVAQEMDGLADTPVRSAFLVDAGGAIRAAHLYDSGQVPDVDQLLAEAREMAAGG
jgi:peroxiredoxin